MEYGFMQKLFGHFYHSSCMKQAAKQKLDIDKEAIKQEYVSIIKMQRTSAIQTHEFLLHGGIFYRLKP